MRRPLDESWHDESDDEIPVALDAPGRRRCVAAAVFQFISASFNAVTASCMLSCGVLAAAAGGANEMQIFPRAWMQWAAIIAGVLGIMNLLAFVGQIVAGIGLLRYRRWARTLSLFLATYALVYGLTTGWFVVPKIADAHEGEAFFAGIGVTSIALNLIYAVAEYALLLSPRLSRQMR